MGAATSTENAQQSESAPSYWSIMRQGYEELVNAIIRPPRADYDPARLGPTEFEFCGRSYRREDLVLRNARGWPSSARTGRLLTQKATRASSSCMGTPPHGRRPEPTQRMSRLRPHALRLRLRGIR